MTADELLACLIDRPCGACKFHTNQGCSKWTCVFEDKIEELPSAERKGHWIECEDYDGDIYYECSECEEDFCLIDGTPADNLYFYCPNCGSHNPTIKRMEGEEE